MTIFTIILIIVSFILTLIALEKYSGDCLLGNIIFALFYTVIGFAFVFLALLGISRIGFKETKSEVMGVTYIQALSSNSQTNGSFFLGCGNIEREEYYFFVSESEHGYQINKIRNVSKVYIKEDSPIKPYIEYTNYRCTHINWFVRLFLKPSFFDSTSKYIIFHLPKNSIIKQFNVDVSKL